MATGIILVNALSVEGLMEERKWIFGLREDQSREIWRKGLKQRKCWPPRASIDLSSSFAGCSDMRFWQHMLTNTGLSAPTLGYFWTQTLSMARRKEMGWWGTVLEPAPSLLQTQNCPCDLPRFTPRQKSWNRIWREALGHFFPWKGHSHWTRSQKVYFLLSPGTQELGCCNLM